jgi:hypothetical protein
MKINPLLARSAPIVEEGEPATPAQPPATNGGGVQLHSVYEDPEFIVFTDGELTEAQGRVLADRLRHAYAYGLKQEQWEDPETAQGQIRAFVLKPETFAATFPPGAGAATIDANTIVLPMRTTEAEVSPLDLDVLAHELVHIQDFRQAGLAPFMSLPTYFREGKAFVLGNDYSERFEENHDYMRSLAGGVVQLTDELITRGFAQVMPNMVNELGGALYMEYLRTRLNGTGIPDAWQRAAEVVNQIGEGVTFQAAFQDQFGTTPDAALNAFKEWVNATEGNPTERLRGTIYEQPANPEAA